MSKIQKQQINILPKTDWDIFPWTSEIYQRHESDFQKILSEYREMVRKYDGDVCMARWKWIESKFGLIMIKRISQTGVVYYEPTVVPDKYPTISNMFGRFSEWLYFKERKETTPEKLQEKKNEISKDIKKFVARSNFGIPEIVKSGVDRDIAYEQGLLDNF